MGAPSGPSRADVVQSEANRLSGQITSAEGITDQTRQELLNDLTSLGRNTREGSAERFAAFETGLPALQKRLEEAQAGASRVARSRQGLEERRRLIEARPGRRQTLLTR